MQCLVCARLIMQGFIISAATYSALEDGVENSDLIKAAALLKVFLLHQCNCSSKMFNYGKGLCMDSVGQYKKQLEFFQDP